MRKLTRVKLK